MNLTPCVYPLIPVTLSYFGGRKSKGPIVAESLLYVSGIALTNSALGVTAALTGGLMGALLQHPAVLMAIAAVMIAMAASLFGFWELRVPYGVMQAATRSRTGYLGSLGMGLVMGIVAAPCIGPFVLGLLTWVAGMGSPWLGFVVFFTLSLGLGLPLFFLAIFSGSVSKLPRSGEWMLWVRKLLGWVLIGMAVYFLLPLFPRRLSLLIQALTAFSAGIHLGWIDQTKAGFKAFGRVKSVFSIAALVLAAVLIFPLFQSGPGTAFKPLDDYALDRAKEYGRPVILDFYASWCGPCRELEHVTFRDERVRQMAEKQFELIKVDLTGQVEPPVEKLIKDFDIKGVPTLVFLDSSGNEIKDLRLMGFEPPDAFLDRLEKVIKRLGKTP